MSLHVPPDAAQLPATVLDVDGVLLASPREQAWRDPLDGSAEPVRFTTAEVAGKPRLAGALAALQALGVRTGGRAAGRLLVNGEPPSRAMYGLAAARLGAADAALRCVRETTDIGPV